MIRNVMIEVFSDPLDQISTNSPKIMISMTDNTVTEKPEDKSLSWQTLIPPMDTTYLPYANLM